VADLQELERSAACVANQFAAGEPVDAAGAPSESSGDDLCTGGVFVDRCGQVAGELQLAADWGAGVAGAQFDGVDWESVLGQHVPVGEVAEQVPLGQCVDRLFVALDEVALAVLVGPPSTFLEGINVLHELGPDLIQEVAELVHPLCGADPDLLLDLRREHPR
jgi:hypothetical protein